MEKYYPEVWKDMVNKRDTQVYSCMHANMVKAWKKASTAATSTRNPRQDLHHQTRCGVWRDLSPDEVSFAEVYMELFRYHIRGILVKKASPTWWRKWPTNQEPTLPIQT